MYEYIENLKAKFLLFKHRNDQFVPAGTTKITEAKVQNQTSSFSFPNLKSINLKSLDFNTKRLIVLGAVTIFSLITILALTNNYSTFLAERKAYRLSQDREGSLDAWDEYVANKRKAQTTPNSIATPASSTVQQGVPTITSQN